MDIKKANYHIKRIQTLLDLHPDGLTPLDKDIILEDIRRLYEVFIDFSDKNQPKSKDNSATITQDQPVMPKNKKLNNDPIIMPDTTIDPVPPIPVKQEPSYEPAPQMSEIPAPPMETLPNGNTNEPDSEGIKPMVNPEPLRAASSNSTPVVQQPAQTSKIEFISEKEVEVMDTPPQIESESYPDLFQFKIDDDLSGKLGNAKIENLNKVLSINDKILYINQLFGGEAIPFQEALKKFQSFYTFAEAKQYASLELVEKYNWTKKDKLDIVHNFMKQVSRLY